MPSDEPQIAFHLYLHPDEAAITAVALNLLVSDGAHQGHIRELAREVLGGLDGDTDENGTLIVALGAEQMKVTHTALHLLLDDLQQEQAGEIELLNGIIAKLPGEHDMRAIQLK
jgi:hypothetical protein